jgi:hypothetical protein
MIVQSYGAKAADGDTTIRVWFIPVKYAHLLKSTIAVFWVVSAYNSVNDQNMAPIGPDEKIGSGRGVHVFRKKTSLFFLDICPFQLLYYSRTFQC